MTRPTLGKLIVTEFVTLDGVAQAPGGPEEDRAGGFAHGGWQGPLADQESGQVMFEQAKTMDALLLNSTVPTALGLAESVTYPSGTLHLSYETAGVPTYADLAPPGVGRTRVVEFTGRCRGAARARRMVRRALGGGG